MDENKPTRSNSALFSESDRSYYLFALKIIGDFGASIAIPVVCCAYLGQYADSRFGTTPYLLAAGFVVSALGSGYLIFRKAKTYGRQYEQLNKKNPS